MLSRCIICNALMSSPALDFHRSQHDPFGRPFKCQRGCIKTYFATYDERHMHSIYLHGDDQNVKPEMFDKLDVKPIKPTAKTVEYFSESLDSTSVKSVKPWQSSSSRAPTACTICDRMFPKSHLTTHMRLHDPTGRPHECVLGCRSTYFSTARSLDQHCRDMHNEIKSRLCTVCGQIVNSNMARHMDTHDSTRPFRCTDGCVERFCTSIESFGQHRRDVHGMTEVKSETDQSATCTVCGKLQRDKAHMTQHMKLHSEWRRPFACTHGCPETFFPSASAETSHARKVHAVRKSATCTVCGKIVSGSIYRHMSTHDSTRPFTCTDGCVQMFFLDKHGFLAHRRNVHNIETTKMEETVIPCDVCGRMTVERFMRQHMVMHQSEGRVPCTDGCTKLYFTNQTELQKHHRRVHGVQISKQFSKEPLEPSSVDNMTPLQLITDDQNNSLPPEPIFVVKKDDKHPTGLRSIKSTPTVQMQMKMEPVSPPAKRARLATRPPSPPVYDQLDDQGVDKSMPKPPSLTVLHDVDLASGSRSSAMPSVSLSRSLIDKNTNRTRLPSFYLSDVDHDHDYAEKTFIESSAGEMSENSSAYSPSSNNSDSRWSPVKRRRRLKQRVRQPRRRKRAASTSSDDSNADDDYHNKADDDDVESSFIDDAVVSDSRTDSDSDSDSGSSFIGRKVKSRLRELKRQIINLQSTASRKEQAN